jgi:hypothetical protein
MRPLRFVAQHPGMPVDPGDACLVSFVLGVELEPDAFGVESEPAAHLALERLDAGAGGGGHADRAVGSASRRARSSSEIRSTLL